MSPIMIGIAAVVAIVILAGVFFFLKNKQGGASNPPAITSRPKTLAEQQQELAERPVAPTALVSTADDDLRTAQSFINQQDFTSASNVLKKSIKNNPTRSDLYFMLLNTFALSKDYDNFNKFYPAVIALDNPVTTSHAQSLKKLVDDELAFNQSLTQPVPTTPNVAPMAQPVPVSTAPSHDEPLSFDLGFDEPVPTPKTAPAQNDDMGMSFDFDVADTSTTNTTVTPKPAESTVMDLDADFDFDVLSETIEAPKTVTPVEEPIADLGTDFDFDLPSETVEAPAPQVQAPVVEEPSMDLGADFDFDLPSETFETPASQVQAAVVEEPIADLGTDFDFDLPSETVETPAPQVQAPVVETFDIVDTQSELISDDLIFDDTPVSQTPEPIASEPTPVVTPESAVVGGGVAGLVSELGNITDIDSTQLNIELAEQYVELGEFDSAKRLLNEVQNTTNSEFTNKIKSLLEKIS
nr:FimV/HubP family polar landmark protein [uncultured Moraxella sp.]